MKEKYQVILKKVYKFSISFYIIILLYLMFFGFGRKQYDLNIVRFIPLFSTFSFVKDTILWKTIIINVFGNVLMFIPFGFLGIISQKFNDLKTLIFNFASAIFLLESLQYFTRLGVFDIDDIILNTLGVAIGFWIYKKLLDVKIKKFNF